MGAIAKGAPALIQTAIDVLIVGFFGMGFQLPRRADSIETKPVLEIKVVDSGHLRGVDCR